MLSKFKIQWEKFVNVQSKTWTWTSFHSFAFKFFTHCQKIRYSTNKLWKGDKLIFLSTCYLWVQPYHYWAQPDTRSMWELWKRIEYSGNIIYNILRRGWETDTKILTKITRLECWYKVSRPHNTPGLHTFPWNLSLFTSVIRCAGFETCQAG